MSDFKEEDLDPRKYFVKDLVNKAIPFHVWIQGTVTKSTDDDILIINDSNNVKVIDCKQAQRNYKEEKFVKEGDYCCVIGKVISATGLAVIKAIKIINLSQQSDMKEAWNNEVREASLVLEGKYQPEFK